MKNKQFSIFTIQSETKHKQYFKFYNLDNSENASKIFEALKNEFITTSKSDGFEFELILTNNYTSEIINKIVVVDGVIFD